MKDLPTGATGRSYSCFERNAHDLHNLQTASTSPIKFKIECFRIFIKAKLALGVINVIPHSVRVIIFSRTTNFSAFRDMEVFIG